MPPLFQEEIMQERKNGGSRLKDRVAIVTGGAYGIGRAFCQGLADEGARVVVADIVGDVAEATAKDIEAEGGEAMALKTDVSILEDNLEMARKTVERFGRIDILVNNAGIYPRKKLVDMLEEFLFNMFDVNVFGMFRCAKEVLPAMMEQRYGKIVNMSSVVGLSGNPGQTNYAAAKAGLIGFTKALAREVASRNITVNSLAPGFVTTGMVEVLSEETRKQILGRIPMGRFGTVEDVAQAALFLCSDHSSYITGQVLTVDGGLIA